jgi:Tfp pilus assembly protein PilX
MRIRMARQRGVILVISLIMLVIMTLFVLASTNLGKTDLKAITKLQNRRAAEAAAQQALARVASNPSNFTAAGAGPTPNPGAIDFNGTGVVVAAPVCLQANRAWGYDLNNSLAPQDTVWDVHVSALDRANSSRVTVVVHEGFQIRLPAGNCR